MSATVNVASSGEWQRILTSSTVVIADCKCRACRIAAYRASHLTYFISIVYADWCGPCKMIAPVFESLATKYSKPRKITFCKINVDNQQTIAQSHGVSAMPTFLVFKSGSVIETIKGANPPALTAAVEKAVKMAGAAAPGASFAAPGRTLGSGGSGGGGGSLQRPGRGGLSSRSWRFSPFNFTNALLTFVGLYFVSLFSVSFSQRALQGPPRARCPPF